RVVFTGPRQDVDDFYTISDVFLFPTHYEPFSNVVLEAMSLENAVFTTKQNGAHEILEDEYIMSNSRDFSVVGKIDALLEDVEALNAIKQVNNLKDNN
ncbi:MAG TPA: glycosyltransferase, partial [Flavobacteriales bacterium]|nr:glycosyltransferase [Flavobacteriales bacterium]